MHNNISHHNSKPKNLGKSLKQLTVYLKPYTVWIFLAIILSVAGAICMILGPLYLGNITKYCQDFISSGNKHLDEITMTAFILIGIYVSSAASNYLSGFIMTGVTQRVSNKMRKDISEKINTLPLSYFDTRSFGDVLSRVTNDVDMVAQNLNQCMSQMISAVTLFIGVLIMMFTLQWQLALVAVITVPLSLILIMITVRFSQKYFRMQQKALGSLNGHIEEVYAGHTVIKAFNQEESEYKNFEKLNGNLQASAWKSQFLSGMMMPVMMFIGNLAYTAIAVVGSILVVYGKGGIENIQMFIQYSRLFNQPIQQIGQITNVLQSCGAASERVFEFLAEDEMTPDVVKKELSKDDIIGNVEFKNVNFGYTKERQIIFDFNCNVKAGSKIAIVGPTGAGKTTLVNLLMRFYEVNSGDILIDGVKTTDLSRENVRSLFGMVLQDTWLFEGTLRDNLTFSRPEATDEEIYKALKACHLDHFVNSLPGGLNYVLDENANVSAGQKQLLTIARTMIANAPMLILDEATSSVDTRTEALIQEAMDKLMENRTSFVIAHRLSTIKNADVILVLKDGNVIEQGNHEALIAKNGFYASLYNSQFEL